MNTVSDFDDGNPASTRRGALDSPIAQLVSPAGQPDWTGPGIG
ncbi:MAG: hypothetical protein ACK562_10210 [Acidobacteriota bacterium]